MTTDESALLKPAESDPGPKKRADMLCEDVLRVLATARQSHHLVITNQMSARLWPTFSRHPLDFIYLSSTMGGAVPLGLGIALARPDLEVIVISGDGSLLMNLGCLVTVAGSRPANLTVVLLDNGLYEVTGGQATPGRLGQTDFAGLARAAQWREVATMNSLTDWQRRVECLSSMPGPRFYAVPVQPVGASTPRHTGIIADQEWERLRQVLAASKPR